MSLIALFFKGPEAFDNPHQQYAVFDDKPKDAIAERTRNYLLNMLGRDVPPYVPMSKPGEITNVQLVEEGWKICAEETGFYRIENQVVIQGRTAEQRSEWINFWTEMKSKMYNLHMAAGGTTIGSIVLAVVLFAKVGTPLGAAMLLTIALASFISAKVAKIREAEAEEAVVMYQYHPGTYAIQDRKQLAVEEMKGHPSILTDVQICATVLQALKTGK